MRHYIQADEALKKLESGERVFCEMKKYGTKFKTEMSYQGFEGLVDAIINNFDSYKFYQEKK